ARAARRDMLLHLQTFALFQAPVHVRQNLVFHSRTVHNCLPSLPWVYFYLPCSAGRSSSTSLASPRGGLVPLATFRTPEKAAILARSPSIRESLQYLHNPALDTYARAPPLAVSPAACRSHGGSSFSALPPPCTARCSDASRRRPAASHRHLPNQRSPAHQVRLPSAGVGCLLPSSTPNLSRSGKATS